MKIFLNFFYRYWITIVLVIILSTLIRQNFFINEFPFSLDKKQVIIDKNIQENELLKQQNEKKQLELQANSDANNEILESQARYRLGLVKKGERYYQISEHVNDK